MRRKTIKVRAGEGLVLPLPSGLAINAVTDVLTPETVLEVKLDRFTRGRLACGDMVEVPDEAGTAAAASRPRKN